MAMKNGCNKGMAEKSGQRSTRIDPKAFARNNLAMGGVNKNVPAKPMKGKK